MSLSDFKVTAVVPVTDIDRASEFYKDVLGLEVLHEFPDRREVLFKCGGDTSLQIYVTDAGPSGATVATWEVDDIDHEVAWFRHDGVEFLNFAPADPNPLWIFTDDNGFKAAWFTDPDGNYLCLHQSS